MLHQKIRPNYIQKFAKTIQKFVQIFPMSACFGQGRPWVPKRVWSPSSYIFLNGCKHPCTPSHSIRPGTHGRNFVFWLIRSILHGHLKAAGPEALPPKTRCDHLPKNSPVGFLPGSACMICPIIPRSGFWSCLHISVQPWIIAGRWSGTRQT